MSDEPHVLPGVRLRQIVALIHLLWYAFLRKRELIEFIRSDKVFEAANLVARVRSELREDRYSRPGKESNASDREDWWQSFRALDDSAAEFLFTHAKDEYKEIRERLGFLRTRCVTLTAFGGILASFAMPLTGLYLSGKGPRVTGATPWLFYLGECCMILVAIGGLVAMRIRPSEGPMDARNLLDRARQFDHREMMFQVAEAYIDSGEQNQELLLGLARHVQWIEMLEGVGALCVLIGLACMMA